jgi:hypothetical protein
VTLREANERWLCKYNYIVSSIYTKASMYRYIYIVSYQGPLDTGLATYLEKCVNRGGDLHCEDTKYAVKTRRARENFFVLHFCSSTWYFFGCVTASCIIWYQKKKNFEREISHKFRLNAASLKNSPLFRTAFS